MDVRLLILGAAALLLLVALAWTLVAVSRARRPAPPAPTPEELDEAHKALARATKIDTSLEGLDIAVPADDPSAVLLEPLTAGDWHPPAEPAPVARLNEVSLAGRMAAQASRPATPTTPPSSPAVSASAQPQPGVVVRPALAEPKDAARPEARAAAAAPRLERLVPVVRSVESGAASATQSAPTTAPAPVVVPVAAPEPVVESLAAPVPVVTPKLGPAAQPAPGVEPPAAPAAQPAATSEPVSTPASGPEPAELLGSVIPASILSPQTALVPPPPPPQATSEPPLPSRRVSAPATPEPVAPLLVPLAPPVAPPAVAPLPIAPQIPAASPPVAMGPAAAPLPPRPVASTVPERPAVQRPLEPPPATHAERPKAVVRPGALGGLSKPAPTGIEPARLHEEGVAAPSAPEFVLSAPVEMWFGESRVGVRRGTRTWEQFRRYADILLGDLQEPPSRDR